ncbi:DUF2092 domain-containing protein [Roseiconus nitratireducens]|uniref:DUF2092 domain-containing protein n=1 Tax=Roseiconus nitratireducens TaxID=2605748 RepID=UPI0013756212|nr:DUF2092 domain-containing protein [Roseiconus nitratireducens]
MALILPLVAVGHAGPLLAQDTEATAEGTGTPPAESSQTDEEAADRVPESVVALQPLFQRIQEADSIRASVELSADTVVDGAVISQETSVYQIASTAPDQFTAYLKGEKIQTRVYSDGETAVVALSPTAFCVLEKPIAMQNAVFQLPVPLGPYPEAVLALTLAGVDPSLTLTTGMKSVVQVGRENFRGRTPSVHFTGLQDDDVRWDLWITEGDQPVPLRLRIDLSDMLRANGALDMPPGYRFTLRLDFKVWRLNHPNDPSLYRYTKVEGAQEFESVQAYYRSLAGEQPSPPPSAEE